MYVAPGIKINFIALKMINKWAVAATTFVIVLLSDYLYRAYLFDLSLTLIPKLQASRSDSEMKFWASYTDLAEKCFEFLPFFISFAQYENRPKAVFYACLTAFTSQLYNSLKLALHSPRPFFENPEISTFGDCEASYGNPSGHSTTAFGVGLTVWLHETW